MFIDTSIFVSQNYDYAGPVFKNIARLSNARKTDIFVTDIILLEIQNNLDKEISKTDDAFLKVRKDARVLKNLGAEHVDKIFPKLDKLHITKKLKKKLSGFLEQARVTVIPASNSSIDTVFAKYFSGEPPFGTGRKKSEFPDAFSMIAIEEWCKRKHEKMYVVSKDKDIESYCRESRNLIFLDDLAKFIDNVETHDDYFASVVLEKISNNKQVVEDAISESFVDQDFWIADQEGDVNEVQVNDQHINDIYILKAEQNYAIVQIDVSTNYDADIAYGDTSTVLYGGEDGVYLPWESVDKTVEQNVDYVAILHVVYNEKDPTYFEVTHVDIDTDRNLGFYVHSGEERFYK